MGNIISRAYGKEYRENVVDSLLSFNATQTWTVSAGVGSGDLDECNGRVGVTPEFPDGIYHYYATDTYPFFQRCVKGEV